MSACLFCKITAGEVNSQTVHEDDLSLAFKDINPVAPTHVLVIPKKHIPSLSAAADEDRDILGHLQRVIAKIAAAGGLKDFRVVVNNGRGAGQTVEHLHYHLISGRRMAWPPG